MNKQYFLLVVLSVACCKPLKAIYSDEYDPFGMKVYCGLVTSKEEQKRIEEEHERYVAYQEKQKVYAQKAREFKKCAEQDDTDFGMCLWCKNK